MPNNGYIADWVSSAVIIPITEFVITSMTELSFDCAINAQPKTE